MAAAAVSLLLVQGAYAATAAEEGQALFNQGNYAEALKKLDQHLAKNPQDAEARFTRGLSLVKLSRTDEAIKVFTQLTKDYPSLPEPFNNLAVLHAQAGDYEKARDALEAALATHPSYATAHENLGDIYAALAGAAYNRALTLEPNNGAVRGKLGLIAQLDNPNAAPAPRPTAVAAAPAVAAPVAAPVVTPAAAPAPVAVTPLTQAQQQAVLGAVNSWAEAWAAKNSDAYLATYSSSFRPEGGLSRSAWETQRRERIARPKRIGVKVNNASVTTLENGRARVNFIQDYSSDSFSDQVSKVLELEAVGADWKITREYSR